MIIKSTVKKQESCVFCGKLQDFGGKCLRNVLTTRILCLDCLYNIAQL